MSSSLKHEKNDQQPPTKRQRIVPKGISLGSTPSRLMSPPHPRKNLGDSSSTVVCHPSTDIGPIFTDVHEIDECFSIESALGVPTRILFRRVGGDRKEATGACSASNNTGKNKENRRRLRPLMSRQEMEQFLRLSLLAQEIDVLVDLSETVLSRRQFARRFRRDVLMQRDASDISSNSLPWKNPWLTTLGPILDVLEQRQLHTSKQNQLSNFVSNKQQNPQEDILHHIHNELTRLYHELQACGIYELERSAEQNRSLVASLTDILGYHSDDLDNDDNDSGRASAVRNLAQEKHSLSKLQDLLAKRVRSLLVVLCHSRTTTPIESNVSRDSAKKDGEIDIGDNDHNDRKQILFDEQISSTSTHANTEKIDNDKNLLVRKNGPHEENNSDENKASDDDESFILSLEEILIPLEVICEKFFARVDQKLSTKMMSTIRNKTVSHSENGCDKFEIETIAGCTDPIQKQKEHNIHQEKAGLQEANKESSLLKSATAISTTTKGRPSAIDFTVEDFGRKTIIPAEASQRTVGAADIMMTLSTKAGQDLTAHKKMSTKPDCAVEDSDRKTMVTEVVSQRTVGAATTMMALATKAGQAFTTHKKLSNERDDIHKINNNSIEVVTDDITNINHPRTQQYPDNNDDDDSFVDDPRSDGEDGSTDCKESAASNMGIFDVVDVLTPQSQSQS